MFLQLISNSINRILSRLESMVAKPKLNLFQTIWVNFRLLQWKEALKLPIFIYGHYSLQTLSGGGRIKGGIYRGMIRIGMNRDWFYSSKTRGLLSVPAHTQIVFNGPCFIGNGCTIRMSGQGQLLIGSHALITSRVIICCENNITIGDYARITFGCQVRDTNFHYFLDTSKMIIPQRRGKISIGAACWIGNHCVVTKGAKIPDYSLTAQGSLLNKDYLKLNEGVDEPLFLVGTPAKIKGKGLKKIMIQHHERQIDQFFYENDTASYMDGKEYNYSYQDL